MSVTRFYFFLQAAFKRCLHSPSVKQWLFSKATSCRKWGAKIVGAKPLFNSYLHLKLGWTPSIKDQLVVPSVFRKRVPVNVPEDTTEVDTKRQHGKHLVDLIWLNFLPSISIYWKVVLLFPFEILRIKKDKLVSWMKFSNSGFSMSRKMFSTRIKIWFL